MFTGGAKLNLQGRRCTGKRGYGRRPTTLKGCNGPAGILGDCAVDTPTEPLVCGHWDDQIVLHLHSCKQLGSLRIARCDV